MPFGTLQRFSLGAERAARSPLLNDADRVRRMMRFPVAWQLTQSIVKKWLIFGLSMACSRFNSAVRGRISVSLKLGSLKIESVDLAKIGSRVSAGNPGNVKVAVVDGFPTMRSGVTNERA